MDSTYKAQLVNKLDTIIALERSGYGLVRKQHESTGHIVFTASIAILSIIAFSLLVVII